MKVRLHLGKTLSSVSRFDFQNKSIRMYQDYYSELNSTNMLYPDSGISMDEELVLGDMIWSYNKAELLEK